MLKHDPCNEHSSDHNAVTRVGSDCIESTREVINKFLESIIRLLSKSMIKPHGTNANPFHLNCSLDKACNGSDSQKNYQDVGIYFHGTLKKNQGNFCKN